MALSPAIVPAVLPCPCRQLHEPTFLKKFPQLWNLLILKLCIPSRTALQNIFHILTMDVVTKVGVGHHKDGDVGQAEQNFIAGFWYVPIYDGFNKEAYLPTHVGKLG